jgi:hypothetical protein
MSLGLLTPSCTAKKLTKKKLSKNSHVRNVWSVFGIPKKYLSGTGQHERAPWSGENKIHY